jgi:hypothetical protein
VIFLGAGASAPFDYPPTEPFVEKLKRQIAGGEEQNLLRAILGTRGVRDAEHIIQILDSILELREKPARAFFAGMNLHFSGYAGIRYDDFENIAANLLNRIRVEIFRTYSWKSAATAKFGLYTLFFSMFEEGILDVFTTNYDRTIEIYCRQPNTFHLYDGFVDDQISRTWRWDPSTLRERKLLLGESRLLRLYKLHGSLNWRKTTGRPPIVEQVPPEEPIGVGGEDSYAGNVLIYPGGKTEPTSKPFDWLYEAFRNKMKVAALCVAVGFSFRDPYLNEVFLEFLKRENTELISVSPTASHDMEENLVKDLFQDLKRRTKIVPIDKKFEESTLVEVKKCVEEFQNRYGGHQR